MGAAILETVLPYLVLDESLTFALRHGPLSFLISSVVSVYSRLNRRPSKIRRSRSRPLSMVRSNHVSKDVMLICFSLGWINYPYFRPLMFTLVCEYYAFIYLTYRAMPDKRVEYKAGFGTKPWSWHRCIEVVRIKLDKRLKCDAESDASNPVPAATLKLIFSANKCWPTVLAPFCLSGILVEILLWNFQLFIITLLPML